MSNAYVIKDPKPVKVILKDIEYMILMDMNAMERLEDTYGTIKNAFEAFGFKMNDDLKEDKLSAEEAMSSIKISTVKNFLFAGLATEHEEAFSSAKDVGRLIGMGSGFQVALEAVFEAIGSVQEQAETASEMLMDCKEEEESIDPK